MIILAKNGTTKWYYNKKRFLYSNKTDGTYFCTHFLFLTITLWVVREFFGATIEVKFWLWKDFEKTVKILKKQIYILWLVSWLDQISHVMVNSWNVFTKFGFFWIGKKSWIYWNVTLRLSYLYDPWGNNFIQIAVYCLLKIEIFQRIILSRLDMQILSKNTFLAMFDG